MTNLLRRALLGAVLAVAFVAPSVAHEVKLGSLEITDLWARATPPGAPTAAGYLTITNHGNAPDKLTGVSTPAAKAGELHIMKVENGVMTMRPAEGGIEIPAGGTVTLAPGGFHLMFISPKEQLKDGGELPVTLTFATAGKVDTFLHIMPIGSKGPAGTAGTMNMDMNGGAMNGDSGQSGTGQ
jgi:copper(I)-binding protein